MPDVKPLLVATLLEALRQIQRYVVLGLGTSFSALVLALAAPGKSQMVIPGTFVPVSDSPRARPTPASRPRLLGCQTGSGDVAVMLSLIAIAVSASRSPELAKILHIAGALIVGAYGTLALEWRDGALFIRPHPVGRSFPKGEDE